MSIISIWPATAAISVSPNPFKSAATVRFPNPDRNARLSLHDSTGKQVMVRSGLSGNTFTLPGHAFPAGIYLLKVDIGGKTMHRRLMILQ